MLQPCHRVRPQPRPSWIACHYRFRATAISCLSPTQSDRKTANEIILLGCGCYNLAIACVHNHDLRGLRATIDSEQQRSHAFLQLNQIGRPPMRSYSWAADATTLPSRASTTTTFVDCVPLSIPSNSDLMPFSNSIRSEDRQ